MWFLLNNNGVITNKKTVITMTDNKKEQERNELHRTIWAIADEMRGSVDGWDFKSYILGILFYRYISENITNYINRGEWESGNTGFDYADLKDSVVSSFSPHNCSAMSASVVIRTTISTRPSKRYSPQSRQVQRARKAKTTSRVCLQTST